MLVEAIYRCYDNKRRSWTDQQPARQEQVVKNREKTTRRAKQNQVFTVLLCVCKCTTVVIQLYTRRAKYLKGKEKEYWDSLDPSFMSEESAHESDGELVMHKHTPVYRSEGRF